MHLLDRQLAVAGALAEIVDLLLDVGAVDLRIDCRNIAKRLHAGLHEKAHEAEPDPVLLLESIAIGFSKLHHRTHVRVVERGEHCGVVLRFLQPARDGLAEPCHGHALLARLVARC